MALAELVVGHGEPGGREVAVIGLAGALDVAGTPAWIDEFPCTAVDSDSVPGVAGDVACWEGIARFEGGETVALAVTADDYALEASGGSESSEESSVAFADCKTGCNC